MCAAFEIGGGGYLLFGGDGVALNFHGFYPHRKTNIKTSASAAAAKQNFIINAFMRNDASSVLLIYFLLCDERKQIAV